MSEAFQNIRDEASRWPRTEQQQKRRLTGIAKPTYAPSFKLADEDRIFTIGSCFARNIEAHLSQLGTNIAANELSFPEHLSVRGPGGAAMMNKFVAMSIENELRWALEPGASFPEETLWEVRPGLFMDPHLAGDLPPQPLELVLERRKLVTEWFASIKRSKAVVITLGVAEAWFDRVHEVYFNTPPPLGVRKMPGRDLELHLLSYDDILQCLERIHGLLSAHLPEGWKFLITVSPVAMGATFTSRDVLVANTYSKSVQRAAVEAFVRRHDNVDYFPSYESIVLSDRSLAYERDQAHIASAAVRSNMIRMVRRYFDGREDSEEEELQIGALDLLQKAFAAEKLGRSAEALKHYEAAAEGSEDPDILFEYGRYLLQMKASKQSAEILRRAKLNGAERLGVDFFLCKALYRSGEKEEAELIAAEAVKRDPSRAGVLNLAARIKFDLGKFSEAKQLARRSKALGPRNENAELLIQQIRALTPLQKALAAEKLGKHLAALKHYEDATVDSNDPADLFEYGRYLLQTSAYKESAEILKRAKTVEPDRSGIDFLLCRALYKARKMEEAELVAADALEREPRRAGVLNLAGQIKLALGKFEEAKQLARRANQVSPGNDHTRRLLQKIDKSLAATAPAAEDAA